jgi:hypothetical protein
MTTRREDQKLITKTSSSRRNESISRYISSSTYSDAQKKHVLFQHIRPKNGIQKSFLRKNDPWPAYSLSDALFIK